jgi:hypothetical protein
MIDTLSFANNPMALKYVSAALFYRSSKKYSQRAVRENTAAGHKAAHRAGGP